MKKIITIFFAIVMAIALAACTDQKNVNNNEQEREQAQEQENNNTKQQNQNQVQEQNIEEDQEQEQLQQQERSQQEGEQNRKSYRNNDYGFSMNFPEGWEQIRTQKRTLNWGDQGNSDSIDFGLPAQDSLFNISVHTKEQWQSFNNYNFPKPMYLGENEKYVFGYGLAQDAANQEIIDRMKEVEEIVGTFQLDQ